MKFAFLDTDNDDDEGYTSSRIRFANKKKDKTFITHLVQAMLKERMVSFGR